MKREEWWGTYPPMPPNSKTFITNISPISRHLNANGFPCSNTVRFFRGPVPRITRSRHNNNRPARMRILHDTIKTNPVDLHARPIVATNNPFVWRKTLTAFTQTHAYAYVCINTQLRRRNGGRAEKE